MAVRAQQGLLRPVMADKRLWAQQGAASLLCRRCLRIPLSSVLGFAMEAMPSYAQASKHSDAVAASVAVAS